MYGYQAKRTEKKSMTVKEIMSNKVIFMNENDSVAFAISILDRCQISGTPVVNDYGKIVGSLSLTDFIKPHLLEALGKKNALDNIIVKDVMNRTEIVKLIETEPVDRAAQMMLANRVHRVYIKNRAERLIGVVSSYDVLKSIVGAHVQEGSDVVEACSPQEENDPEKVREVHRKLEEKIKTTMLKQ